MNKTGTLSSRCDFGHISLPALLKRFWDSLPAGGSLPNDVWQSRHRFLLGLTWFHALLIALIGPVLGYRWEFSLQAFLREDTVLHTIAEGAVVAVLATIATWSAARREIRATAVGFGLMSASAILVHFSGGYIELHFHFFVMLAFLALYQDWIPFLLAIVYVAIHHGVVGVMWPQEVYNHAAAINAPWTWAGIHAFFVLWAAAGSVIAWRFNEKAFAQTKLILNSAAEGIYGLDRDGKVTFINPAAASLLHCEANRAIGKAMHQILRHTRSDGSDFSDHNSPILAALRDGARRQGTDEFFRPQEGASFPVEYACTPIFEGGELTGAVVTFRDITRRKQRDLALRESEERFRQIAENIKEVFWVTDPLKNEWLYVSPAYREIWGRDPISAGSLSQSWLGFIHPEDLGRVLAAVMTKQVMGQYDEQYRIVRADGSIRWVRDRAFPVRNESKKLYRMIGIAEDITERRRTEEDLQSRYKESAILHDVSLMTLSSTDLKAVLEKILERALSVVSLDLGNIRLFEPGGRMRLGVYRGYREPESIRSHHADVKGPNSGILIPQVIASGKSLVVNDVSTVEMGLRTFKKERVCSALLVPIITQEETLGVIEVGSRTPCVFRPDDVRLLEAIGNQVGIAVQKARLVEETERRAQEQAALNLIAKSISQSLRRDELLNIALDKVLEVTERERVSIRLKDPTTGQVTLAAHRGFSDEEIEDLSRRVRHHASEQVVASGQPLVVNNRQEVNDTQSLLPQSRSVAWIPMKSGAKVVGILGVSASSPVPFSEREVEFLQAIGNMIGVALENARLFQESERRNRELQSLYAVASAVGQSLHIDILMQAAIKTIIEVLEVDAGRLYVLDEKQQVLSLVAHRGLPADQLSHVDSYVPGQGIVGRIFEENRPMAFADIANDPAYRSLARGSQGLNWGFRSAVGLPITIGLRPIGVLYVYGRTVREFNAQDTELLSALGGQIGFAIENARLFGETEARYRELQTLRAISDTILDSRDLTVMMERILDQAIEIGQFDVGVVCLLNPTGESIEPVASRGYRDPTSVEGHRKKLGGFTTGAASTRVLSEKSVRVLDLTQSKGMRTLKKEGVCTAVAVPLRNYEEVLGVIQLGSRTRREFSDSELRTLEAIGDQAGIAVQKARLYEETKEAQHALAQKAEELTRSNTDLQRFAEEIELAKEKLEKVNSVLTVQAAELARSNTELEQFAYIASHDLQEPLRMVASYVQLLARRYKGKLEAEADEFIGFAVDGAKRMQDLINALLAYSRIGTKGKEFAPTDCEAVLAIALKNLQIAIEDSRAIITHHALPTVMADAIQLGQLFQNLIGNAIKFRGDRRPAVHISVERNGKEWCFSFRDDGIGIDPQYAERIFVIFQRLHSKEEYPGTGIGLALCKKIAERHGGRIWVESEAGKGSTFRFTMPA